MGLIAYLKQNHGMWRSLKSSFAKTKYFHKSGNGQQADRGKIFRDNESNESNIQAKASFTWWARPTLGSTDKVFHHRKWLQRWKVTSMITIQIPKEIKKSREEKW